MLSLVLLLPLFLSSLKCLTNAKQSHETGQASTWEPISAVAASNLNVGYATAVSCLVPVCGEDNDQSAPTPSPSNDNPISTKGLSVGIASETTSTNVYRQPSDSLQVLGRSSSTTPRLSSSVPSNILVMGHSITSGAETSTLSTPAELSPNSHVNNLTISVTDILHLKNTPSTSEASDSSRVLDTVSSSATNEPQDLIEASNGLSSAGPNDTLNAGPQSRSNSESRLSHPMVSGQILSLSSTPILGAAASLQSTPASIESNPILGAESTKLPVLILGSQTITPAAHNHYAVFNGQMPSLGSASTPNSDHFTKGSALQSVSTQSLLVLDSSSSQVSINAASSAFSKIPSLPTVNWHNITANIPGQYSINGHSLTPGIAATFSGTFTSLAPNANDNDAANRNKNLSVNATTASRSGPAGTNVPIFTGGVRGGRDGLWSSSIALLVAIAVLLWL